MKAETGKGTVESVEQGGTENDFSRRDFLKGTASAVAAGSAIGLMGGASIANAAVAPPEPDSPDTSVRWNTKPGDLYNEKLGNGYL